MRNKNDKSGIVKACVITVGITLILSVAFIFLTFKTDYIFNMDMESTYTSASFDRTSVSTVIEEIENLEAGTGEYIDPSTAELDDWWYTPADETVIEVSFGVDLPTETRIVSDHDDWSIEYSIQGAVEEYGESATCVKRLKTAAALYGKNANESGDLLKLEVNGRECWAGAMVEGVFTPGDIVLVQLRDDYSNPTQFYFMILDVKSLSHESKDLAKAEDNKQIMCKWGHGYAFSQTVNLSVCEFICNQTRNGINSAKNLPSGGFLTNQRVWRAKIVDHVDIDRLVASGATITDEEMPGVEEEEPEEEEPEELSDEAYAFYYDIAMEAYTNAKQSGLGDDTAYSTALRAVCDEGLSEDVAAPIVDAVQSDYRATHQTTGYVDIDADIANGLYTLEDLRYMASAASTEASPEDYNAVYAVCCAIRNRVNSPAFSPDTVKGICLQPNQLNGTYKELSAMDEVFVQAAAACLRGGASNCGECCFWFGVTSGHDLWAESNAVFRNIGGNIFYNEWGTVHTSKDKLSKGAIIIYNHTTGEWLYPNGSSYP